MIKYIILFLASAYLSLGNATAQKERTIWSKEKAAEWSANHGWLRGANFIPSTAINQLEMWQKETFDPATIDRELRFCRRNRYECHAGFSASCGVGERPCWF